MEKLRILLIFDAVMARGIALDPLSGKRTKEAPWSALRLLRPFMFQGAPRRAKQSKMSSKSSRIVPGNVTMSGNR
jgi:hypothetical protein